MAVKTLDDLFHDSLRDVYYAERKILNGLNKMHRATSDPQLRDALKAHREETEEHVERLQRVFEIIGKSARGKTCPAIDGILEEASEILEEYKGSPALDAGILAAAQAVEHYEMTRYGSLRAWAQHLGHEEAVELLTKTLSEESATDKLLNDMADRRVNAAAMEAA